MAHRLKHHHIGFKRWRNLHEEIADGFEAALDHIQTLDPVTFADKREAAEKARDAVLKALYEADAINPPEGIDPS
jgi:hypothetical protein